MTALSKRDQKRLDSITATRDMGGWTQYYDSEPMVGRASRGEIEHAVFQSQPIKNAGWACTRRTLCGQHRMAGLSRATKRAFDADMPRIGKPCAICERLIGPFREWQASRVLTP